MPDVQLDPLPPETAVRLTAFARACKGAARAAGLYPPEHPAAEYLKLRQFLFGRDYPAAFALDKTFYQTVKGMVGALPVVKNGGTILIASECSEGIGNRAYADLMLRYEGRH